MKAVRIPRVQIFFPNEKYEHILIRTYNGKGPENANSSMDKLASLNCVENLINGVSEVRTSYLKLQDVKSPEANLQVELILPNSSTRLELDTTEDMMDNVPVPHTVLDHGLNKASSNVELGLTNGSISTSTEISTVDELKKKVVLTKPVDGSNIAVFISNCSEIEVINTTEIILKVEMNQPESSIRSKLETTEFLNNNVVRTEADCDSGLLAANETSNKILEAVVATEIQNSDSDIIKMILPNSSSQTVLEPMEILTETIVPDPEIKDDSGPAALNVNLYKYEKIPWVKQIVVKKKRISSFPASTLSLAKLTRRLIRPNDPYNLPDYDFPPVQHSFLDFSENSMGFRRYESQKPNSNVDTKLNVSPAVKQKNIKIPIRPLMCSTKNVLPYNGIQNLTSNKHVKSLALSQPPRAAFLTQVEEGNENSTPLRCDRKSDDIHDQQFEPLNRNDHLKYLDMRSKLEQKTFIDNYIAGRKVLTIDKVTDEYAKAELFKMYGPMNEKSKMFNRYLKNYKQLLIEQIKEWTVIAEREMCWYRPKIQKKSAESRRLKESRGLLDQYNFKVEGKKFDLNPLTNISQLDHYIIPRDKLTIMLMKNKSAQVQEDITGVSTTLKRTEPRTKEKVLNILATEKSKQQIIIPTLEDIYFTSSSYLEDTGKFLPFNTHYENYVEEYHKNIKAYRFYGDADICLQLHYTFERRVTPIYMGISGNVFRKNFKIQEGYEPLLKRLNVTCIRGLILTLPTIFKHWPNDDDKLPVRRYPDGYDPDIVIQPKYLVGLTCDQQTFLWRIWHLYLVLLSLNNSNILVENMSRELDLVFGIKFNCEMWGFKSMIQFCNYLLERWPRQGVSIETKNLRNVHGTYLVRYLKPNVKNNLMKVKEPLEEVIFTPTEIPDGYAKKSDQIRHMWNEIKQDMLLRCVVPNHYSPNHFFLKLITYRDQLAFFTIILQKEMELSEKSKNSKETHACSNLLKPFGHFVLVLHEKEGWSRAMTLNRSRHGYQLFKVILIDIGIYFNVHISKIRYLPLKYMKFPAQAIPCRLSIPEALKSHILPRWDKPMLWNFDRFVFDTVLAIKFKKWNCEKKNPIWEVDMVQMKDLYTNLIFIHDIPYRIALKCPDRVRVDDPNDKIKKWDGGYYNLEFKMVLPAFVNGDICLIEEEEDDNVLGEDCKDVDD